MCYWQKVHFIPCYNFINVNRLDCFPKNTFAYFPREVEGPKIVRKSLFLPPESHLKSHWTKPPHACRAWPVWSSGRWCSLFSFLTGCVCLYVIKFLHWIGPVFKRLWTFYVKVSYCSGSVTWLFHIAQDLLLTWISFGAWFIEA